MSAVAYATTRPLPETQAAEPRLFAVEGGAPTVTRAAATVADPVAAGPTLAAVLAERWVGLSSGVAAECLVCGSGMEPRWSAGHGSVGGRCRSCGSSLE